ncbi:TCTP family protein [Penicillium angulare]|uniref:TCTP family protein n=1 Tax=Penicillium angulare TaxID=116970 RepID=UPI0025419A92|nr:TCTP family protein [Penicillium angulare]KAJ5259582.1 TCTP family protein [Penicillium angulare]
MIIYTDILSKDELLSDTFDIKPAADCPILWEVDCRKYMKKVGENVQLEGANPSAEDAEEDGGEGETVMVHDIEDQFRMVWLKVEEGLKPSKDAYKSHLKAYIKKVLKALEAKKASEETIAEFKGGAAAAMKKISANYDNYDVLMGQSMDGDAMHVLIDFREDGVTPFATLWKHGLNEMKV